MKPLVPTPPSFETQDELWTLIEAGLTSPAAEMTPEGWEELRKELEKPRFFEKLAS